MFLQVDRGLLSTDALIGPISCQLIDVGSEFHEQVLRTATPVPVAPLTELLADGQTPHVFRPRCESMQGDTHS